MSFTPFNPKIEEGWRDLLSKLDLLGEYNKLVNQAIKNYKPEENRFLRGIDEFEEQKLKQLRQITKTKEKPIYFEIVAGMLSKINDKLFDISLLSGLIASYSNDLFSVEKSVDLIREDLAKLGEKYDKSSIPFYYCSAPDTPLNYKERHKIAINTSYFGFIDVGQALVELQSEKLINIRDIMITHAGDNYLTFESKIALGEKFNYKANIDDKITLYFSKSKGLSRHIENKKDIVYYEVGTLMSKAIQLLQENEILSGEQLKEMVGYSSVRSFSNVKKKLNNNIAKVLKAPFELIKRNDNSGGYYLNTDDYNIIPK